MPVRGFVEKIIYKHIYYITTSPVCQTKRAFKMPVRNSINILKLVSFINNG